MHGKKSWLIVVNRKEQKTESKHTKQQTMYTRNKGNKTNETLSAHRKKVRDY